MKSWYESLSRRDQRVILWGGIALSIMLAYFMVWEPLSIEGDRLKQDVMKKQEDLLWMQQAAEQFKGASSDAKKGLGAESLLSLVDRTAKQNKLASGIKRVQPDKEGTVRIWLEQVAFDDVVSWAILISKQHGVMVTNASIESQPQDGYVNARLVLSGGG